MQRVAVARALMMDPPLILADEPTGNLDTKTGTAIMELLTDMAHQDGRSVVMVTHNLEAAASTDRVITLRTVGWDPIAAATPSDPGPAASLQHSGAAPAPGPHRDVVDGGGDLGDAAGRCAVASQDPSPDRRNASPPVSAATPVWRSPASPTPDFPQSIQGDVAAVAGVTAAVPMLRTSIGPPSQRVVLLGVDESIKAMLSDLQRAVQEQIGPLVSQPGRVAVGIRDGICEGRQGNTGQR